MEELLDRVLRNMLGRVHGAMHFRLIVQPLTAAYFAIRDGARDAREGRTPYFRALFTNLFTNPGHRRALVASAWKSVGKVFLFALALDCIHQLIELHWLYPGEAIVVAFFLTIVPYVLLRGPVNRLALRRKPVAPHENPNG